MSSRISVPLLVRALGGVVVACALSALGCQSLLGVEELPEPCAQDWWDCRYPTRWRLTIDNAGGSEDLQGVPVLVRFSAPQQQGFNQDGSDLVFVADDQQTVLAHEIDRWDPQGTSTVWVRLPHIGASSTDGTFFLYYGYTDAYYRRDDSEVWGDDYELVLHFNNFFDSQRVVRDSSRHRRLAEVVGTPTRVPDGVIGWGIEFDGSPDQFVRLESLRELEPAPGAPRTLEVWVKTDQPQQGAIFFKENSCRGWSLTLDGASRLHGRVARAGSECMNSYQASEVSVAPIHPGIWHYATVVATNDPATSTRVDVSMYWEDGAVASDVETASRDDIADNTLANDPGYIGVDFSAGNPFVGVLDELRISSSARSAEWIAAQHASMSGALVVFGEIEEREQP